MNQKAVLPRTRAASRRVHSVDLAGSKLRSHRIAGRRPLRGIAALSTRAMIACTLFAAASWWTPAAGASSSPFRRGDPPRQTILNVAHGGASSLAPQNTLEAGRIALDAGADVWGVDVRRTQDGVLVLMHDETLDRTTDAEAVYPKRSPWRVADFLFSEVQALDAGSWFLEVDPFGQIAAGNVPAETRDSYIGEPVPTLREALGFVAANDWLIDVEFKAPFDVDRDVIAAELVSLIDEIGTADRVLVSSFDHDLLHEVRRLQPEIPIGALALLPPARPVETLSALGADVYLPSVVGFTDRLLTELETAGIHVIVWTYNTQRQLEYAAGLPGVDGIYTDFPQRLATLLEQDGP